MVCRHRVDARAAGLVRCASEHVAAVRVETGGNLVAGRNKEAAWSRASVMNLRYVCCRGVGCFVSPTRPAAGRHAEVQTAMPRLWEVILGPGVRSDPLLFLPAAV